MQSQKIYLLVPRLFDVSIFLAKISIFWKQYYLYSKQYSESCVRHFLVLFSVFLRQKVNVNENVRFSDYASRIRLPDCSKLAMNRKMTMTSQFAVVTSSLRFFLDCFVSLANVSYWLKFHLNIIVVLEFNLLL